MQLGSVSNSQLVPQASCYKIVALKQIEQKKNKQMNCLYLYACPYSAFVSGKFTVKLHRSANYMLLYNAQQIYR